MIVSGFAKFGLVNQLNNRTWRLTPIGQRWKYSLKNIPLNIIIIHEQGRF